MSEQSIVVKEEKQACQNREETRAPERFLRPAVSIGEDDAGLTIEADLPGAARESLVVHLDKGLLTINAAVSRQMPGRVVYGEFQGLPYYRQFQIPTGLDCAKVTAQFNAGVLTLRLPKAEAAKPRRIEISCG